ncbi:cysteine desulfurase family protein [Arcicella lustrica]|uniref:cysteine desulfurase n=1 Tax=Arcicella lustrica TaxID=2984196 RepID=A0ABU5SH43_9BACT|nr:cysteine desulfurase family protein [Arcicella sp. DC25W]MEA5426581.1 cysteine desulfurase family protein [Arcicella sp. DC25W]
MEIYCDNAATTSLDLEVLDTMIPYLTNHFGNPSSSHAIGRKAREAVEEARHKIAKLLNASENDIFFTSGATEANNLAISGAIKTYEVRNVITSRLEHKAVLQTLGQYSQHNDLEIDFVRLDNRGNVDFEQFEWLLKNNQQTLVSLMHGNNEIGNLTDIKKIGEICKKYDAIFHSDTTQTIGKHRFDVTKLYIDYIVGSSHKFHGPKGVGFIYINKYRKIQPHIYGGAQERGTRGGTENVAGIVGMAKALEIAYRNLEEYENYVAFLKSKMITALHDLFGDEISFNGESDSTTDSLPNILNVAFPNLKKGGVLVNRLDALGIAVSGGSACSNLTNNGSHVLKTLNRNLDKDSVRFSFCKYNTPAEIDLIIKAIVDIYEQDIFVRKSVQNKSAQLIYA